MNIYRSSPNRAPLKSAVCELCRSNLMRFNRGAITCGNCGHEVYKPKRRNKYNAIRTAGKDGLVRDSKFESSVADELLMRKAAGDILDYDSQFKVELPIYGRNGKIAFKRTWKVDFRVHEIDGSFTLLEAKGKEGADYKWKRDILVNVWLPEHPDYIYEVRTMKGTNSYPQARKLKP